MPVNAIDGPAPAVITSGYHPVVVTSPVAIVMYIEITLSRYAVRYSVVYVPGGVIGSVTEPDSRNPFRDGSNNRLSVPRQISDGPAPNPGIPCTWSDRGNEVADPAELVPPTVNATGVPAVTPWPWSDRARVAAVPGITEAPTWIVAGEAVGILCT
jgi:hypothetical protein